MATGQAAYLLRNLRRLTAGNELDGITDAELLRRYSRERNEASFAALVQRHGPMVWNACARVLPSSHDAEDAFQAAFLVLARKASRPWRDSVAGWLHTVAYRLALGVRTESAQRPAPDCLHAKPVTDPATEVTVREARAVLDEELAWLPERLRAPLVLCYLEDATRDEAARQLGLSLATFKRRLDHGRKLLRARLTRRGVTLSIPLLATGWSERSSASFSPLLTSNTLTAATAFRSSTAAPAGIVTAKAMRLAEGMLRNTPTLPLSLAAAFVLVLVMCTARMAAYLAGLPLPAEMEPESPAPMSAPAQSGNARGAHADTADVPLPAEAVARVGSSRLRTGAAVWGLAYSPDGKIIVSGTEIGLRLWEAETGRLRRQVEAKIDPRGALAFDPDGKAVHLYEDGVVRSVDAGTGKEVRRLALPMAKNAYSAWFTPDGRTLAASLPDSSVLHFDLATGEEKVRLKAKDGNFAHIAFSPNGRALALTGHSSLVQLFKAADGSAQFELQTPLKAVNRMAFSGDGKKLLTAGRFGEPAVIWDLSTRKVLSRLTGDGVEHDPRSAAFSPDGKLIAIGSQLKYVVLYEVATGKEVRRLLTWPTCLNLRFSPNGQTLLVGTGGGEITQWDVETGKPRPASADRMGIHELRFTHGGKHLRGISETYVEYDWKTGRHVRRYPETPTYSPSQASVSLDGALMAFPHDEGKKISLINTETGKEIRTLGPHPQHRGHSRFSPDGKKLVTAATDKIVRIWEVESGKLLHELESHTAFLIERLEVSPDGRWLATASTDGSARGDYDVRLWEVATGRLAHRIPPRRGSASAIAFSPDSTELAIVGGEPGRPNDRGEVSLVDVRTGREKRSFEGHQDRVYCVAFSPDGRSLATGSQDKTLRLWEIASGKERHRFVGHLDCVKSVAFTPDGLFLAASSTDAPVYVWDIYGTNGKADPAPAKWSAADRQRLWDDLTSPDAARAFQAVRRLVGSPGPAVELLRERMRPAAAVDRERVRQLLRDLDSDKFAVRRKANAELEQLGDRIESTLREAWKAERPLESRRRLEMLLGKLDNAGPERSRWVRSLEVLERVGGPEAAQLLATLAGGAAESRQTREAGVVGERMRKR
jgi:RNA polymerase sigma factor (sigma-70 family)